MSDVWVAGLGLWTPGFDGVEAWQSGVADPEPAPPAGRLFGRSERRRATELSRMVADALDDALGGGAGAPGHTGLVLGTVGGELKTTFDCLALTHADPPASSPLRFRNSVHNAALGHIGIAHGNRGYASAMAVSRRLAGAMPLIEGWMACQSLDQPVAVVVADETWPGESWPPLAVAFLLSSSPGPHPWGTLSAPRREAGEPWPAVDGPLAHNPSVGALRVLAAMLQPGTARLHLGGAEEEPPWCMAFESVR